MSFSGYDDADRLQAAWGLVSRSAQNGDVQASFALYHMLQTSLTSGAVDASAVTGPAHPQPAVVHVATTLTPLMLHQCLNAPPGEVHLSTTLFVCVLNRIFCLNVVPPSLAQAMDRRPTGLGELLSFYLGALLQHRDLPLPAQRQLSLCIASLTLLVYDNVAVFLEEAHQRVADGDIAPQLYWLLLTSVMDVILDNRVALGSVRRATQRRRLQEQLHLTLIPTVTGEWGDAEKQRALRLQHTETVDKAIDFLLEGITGEPQEVAQSFWQQLPASELWLWMVRTFRLAAEHLSALPDDVKERLSEADAESMLPSAVVDCVCHVLRCLTSVDAAAESLLLSIVPLCLALMATRATCVAACAVVASALEAATEEVVLHCDPSTPIFQLISSSAEHLMAVLRSDGSARAAPRGAVLSACEGISALTQVLFPMPVPIMEADDDPEDFAYFTQSVAAANADKAAAIRVLQPYLAGCQRVLLQQLGGTHSAFVSNDWELVMEYVRRNTPESPHVDSNDNDNNGGDISAADDAVGYDDDFQISFEETALAMFTTYERLCKLLRELLDEALPLAVAEGRMAGVCVSAAASLDALTRADLAQKPSLLLPESALLPLLTWRFARSQQQQQRGQDGAWPAEAWGAVLAALSATIETAAQERHLAAGAHVLRAAVDIVRAANTLVRQAEGASASPERVIAVTGSLDRLLNAAWRCLLLPGQRPYHWQLSEDIAAVLDLTTSNGATVPQPLLNVMFKQDAHTQVAILSACQMDSIDSFLYILRCVQELTGPEDEEVVRIAAHRLTRRVASLLPRHPPPPEQSAVAQQSYTHYARILDEWHSQHPSFLLLVLQLSECLPQDQRAPLRAACLLRFFVGTGAAETASSQLKAIFCGDGQLASDVCADVALSAPEQLQQLCEALLQPNTAFHAPGAEDRLLALVHALSALQESGRVPIADLCRLLVLGVERCRDMAAAQSMSVENAAASRQETASTRGDRSSCAAVLDKALDGLVALGLRVVATTNTAAASDQALRAPWLPTLWSATDAHEVRRTLRAAIGL